MKLIPMVVEIVTTGTEIVARWQGLMKEIQRLRDGLVHRDRAAWWTDATGARRCSYCTALENCCKKGCPRVDLPRTEA
jgi:hypothetical protein